MGQTGEDLLLSPVARKLLPYQFEIKNKAKSQIHSYYTQATTHGNYEPIVVVKMDRQIPLAIVSLEHFVELLKRLNENH